MPGIAKIRRAPRAAPRQQGKAVADRRAGEFEKTGGKIELRQTGTQCRGRQLEFPDCFGIAAAVSAEQHRPLGHLPILPQPR